MQPVASSDEERDSTRTDEWRTCSRSSDPEILLVDDDEVVHRSIGRILGRAGYVVDTVSCSEEALQRLAAREYALVVTDLRLPGMSGLQLLERLREREPPLPVLVITAFPTTRTQIQALRLGSVGYVTKPFSRGELLTPIQRALAA